MNEILSGGNLKILQEEDTEKWFGEITTAEGVYLTKRYDTQAEAVTAGVEEICKLLKIELT